MGVMTVPRFVLPADRPLTVADLDLTPDDGCRYELDDGVLVVSPAPMPIHQRVLLRLEFMLETACPPEFELLPGPGVVMSEIQYRIPDLVVVRSRSIAVADKNVTRPPELVVEIASPSTAHYDRNRKRTVYAEYGIPAYWIVVPDPARPSLTAYRLADGGYAEVGRAAGEQRFVATTPFPVEIVPAELVAGRWRH
ncbi:MAG: Uma2 family endonuclease [Streptosporangiaceae bacterium]